ncbi:MAG: YbhB/YbcL family Raf kinase inhibitor-like protein [Chitinophagaceae bacterium]|nr:YbhB/YbcL family Raf kinase inhibitor-like protein [Chitinophagaceae bacterium]
MQIKSSEFTYGQDMPEKYTCLGSNINPPLQLVDIPSAARSLILIFEDVDATPKPWTHWMLFNIPTGVTAITEGGIPEGATEGLANNNSFGYEGPCPKYFKGTHHYWFRLYALDNILELPAASKREDVENAMQAHVLEKAELLALCAAPVTASLSP